MPTSDDVARARARGKTRAKSPIDRLIDAGMHCVKCGQKMGTCDCWDQCPCGWSFERGGQCANPIHIAEAVARDTAATVLEKLEQRKISKANREAIEQAVYDTAHAWVMDFIKARPP
jgi:hypothetical protein